LATVRRVLANVTYDNLSKSRKALEELEGIIERGATAAVRGAVTSGLKEMILTLKQGSNGVSGAIREVRKRALDVLMKSTDHNLGGRFENDELAQLDLYGMDFSSSDLSGRSFEGCVLVEGNFKCSRLKGASFSGACVRNADFAGADLTGADFTDADWFNSLNLTEHQLALAARHTLSRCPPNIPAMHRFLRDRYGYSFESWSTEIQTELKMTWKEYLRPGGLREIASRWRN
jgi:uncharacterized protein YjbI with pentapeptide repeats